MSSAAPILSDRWQLLDRIGEGAMGEVWRGRHVVLGHQVAIKLMRREAANDPQLAARFRREARIAAQLRHRCLVRVEDFGATSDGRPFLVMEYLHGESLGAMLRREPKPPHANVVTIVQDVSSACDMAHGAGIVHRDLKPDNCFVVKDDDGKLHVKVLDFGVAKVVDGMFITASGVITSTHSLMGTPMYMSPEQARGEPDLDGRSDLWSLGVITFEMLTGRLPYKAASISQLIFSVLAAPLPMPSSVEPSLSAQVDAWFSCAVNRDRAGRFQSGRQFATALANALGVPLAEARNQSGSFAAPHVSRPISTPAPFVASAASFPPSGAPLSTLILPLQVPTTHPPAPYGAAAAPDRARVAAVCASGTPPHPAPALAHRTLALAPAVASNAPPVQAGGTLGPMTSPPCVARSG